MLIINVDNNHINNLTKIRADMKLKLQNMSLKAQLLVMTLTIIGEGNGNPLQYYCLENPMDRGAWKATVSGVTKELDMT